MKSVALIVCLAMGLMTGLEASAVARDVPIKVFHKVVRGFYRGARPGTVGMEALAAHGVKTDLDLENDDDAIQVESADAYRLGIRFINMPMSGFWAPDDDEVKEILNILTDRRNYPIFIHCKHGQDRTGLIVGLFRVFVQHWTPEDAYREMRAIGFHPILLGLEHYFEEKTGY